jgi:hypothetical protein
MISAQLAVDTLRAVNHGTYTISTHWTTQREFKQSYESHKLIWHKDTVLHDKVFTTYMPHEWINN